MNETPTVEDLLEDPENYIKHLVSKEEYIGYLKICAIHSIIDDDFEMAKYHSEELEEQQKALEIEREDLNAAIKNIEQLSEAGRNDEQV